MIQLFINNKEIDISEGIDIPLTFSQSDAKKPEKRKRNFSKTIKIPGTRKNNLFFQSAYNLHISDVYGDLIGFDFDPTLRYPARVLRNGKPIFKGSAQLVKAVTRSDLTNGRQNEFHINLFSEIVDLFQALGDIKVSELGWSAYNHTLNVTNIENSWTAAVGSGYWYPYIHFGYSQNPLRIKTNQLRPYVYVKEIVEKCFEYAGLSLSGAFFDSDPLNKLTWGSSGGNQVTISSAEADERLISFTGTGTDTFDVPVSDIDVVGVNFWSIMESERAYQYSDNDYISIVQVQDDLSQMDESTGFMVVANAGTYSMDFNSNIRIIYQSVGALATDKEYEIDLIARVLVNGAVINTETFSIYDTAAGSSGLVALNLSQELDLTVGDIVQVDYRLISKARFKNTDGSLRIQFDLISNTMQLSAVQTDIVDGDTVVLASYVPNMKARDFINDIITMFNLYISDPNNDGEVVMLSEQDYFFDTDNVDNWTDKLDRGSDIEIVSGVNIEGKNYRFRWAQDRDYYKQLYFDTEGEDYGDYTYEVPSTFKKGDKVYQLGSAQSCPNQIELTDIIIPQILQKDEATGVVKPHKGKPRFFFNNGTTATTTGWILINSDTDAETTEAVYPQAHHLDDIDTPAFDLNFGVPNYVFYDASAYTANNLFTAYHNKFIRQLTGRDSKLVTAWFKLDESDLYDNFMRRLALIDGVVYRKNLITDYLANSGNLVKVELLRILEGQQINIPGLDNTGVPFEPNGGSTSGGQAETGDFDTISFQQSYLVDTTSGDVTVRLTPQQPQVIPGDPNPPPIPYSGNTEGQIFHITKVAGNNRVILEGQNGALINGQATLEILNDYDTATIQMNGGNYYLI
jgi:hypothetical protein